MLDSLESANNLLYGCKRPVTKELHGALAEFRRRIFDKLKKNEKGEFDELLRSKEFYFKTEDRIIGVRIPVRDTLKVAGLNIRLPESRGARIGFWGLEMKEGEIVDLLVPFSLPLGRNSQLKNWGLGYVDPKELGNIMDVVVNGTQIERADYNRIRSRIS